MRANCSGPYVGEDVDASGTPNIWFDEKLIKGDWPPGSFGFPRVYITAFETDQ